MSKTMSASRPLSRRHFLALPIGAIAVGAGISYLAFARRSRVLELQGSTMGTRYNIIGVDEAGQVGREDLDRAIKSALTKVDIQMSNWNAGSEISQINALKVGESMSLSPEISGILDASQQLFQETGGRFDVATGPLIEAWGFGTEGQRATPPSQYFIDQVIEASRFTTAVELNNENMLKKLNADAHLFLPSIGKGHGVDQVAQVMRDFGFEDFMVEIGGDLVAEGLNPSGQPWQIGIERPTVSNPGVEAVLPVSGQALATSGDYRNYFEDKGVRYSHIIDPTTGVPIQHTTASVSVVAESAMIADAWSTALLVMGHEEGVAFANSRNLAAMFIVRDRINGLDTFEVKTSAAVEALLS